MPSKRKNPIAQAAERLGNAAAKADSMAMSRMPSDFQKMHKRPKPKPKRGT